VLAFPLRGNPLKFDAEMVKSSPDREFGNGLLQLRPDSPHRPANRLLLSRFKLAFDFNSAR
jgi:hypothetical protein